MKYLLKSGKICENNHGKEYVVLASIKNRMCSGEREIQVEGGETFICLQVRTKGSGNSKETYPFTYLMKNEKGITVMTGVPEYADGENPAVVGWLPYRTPRVETAHISFQDFCGSLSMKNSRNYMLFCEQEECVMSITHRGISGGWDVESSMLLPPELICGIFVFCRYLEQENELVVI